MANLLLIEDDKRLCEALEKALRDKNFMVEIAYGGRVGLKMGHSYKYDVIILDLMLPDIDGLEVCRRLREKLINTPILILSARGSLEDRVKGLDMGADDYLPKPFQLKELVARIQALLRRERTLVPEELKVADITVDLTRHEVKRGEEKIKLPTKEYEILTYLLRHRDRVVTRQEIQDNVWGKRKELASNTIDVHIRDLRKRIKEDAERKIIHTIRGEGWRMIA